MIITPGEKIIIVDKSPKKKSTDGGSEIMEK